MDSVECGWNKRTTKKPSNQAQANFYKMQTKNDKNNIKKIFFAI